MGWIEKGAAALGRGLWKIAIALLALGIVVAVWTYTWTHGAQFSAVVNSAGNFATNLTTTAFDWGSSKMGGTTSGGQAGHTGPEVVWVESTAPGGWQLGSAIATWNKGLTSVQLRAGKCHDGAPCIKVSTGAVYTPPGESLVLGRESSFFGRTRITFNTAAIGHVPPSYFTWAARHELGHALGLKHRSTQMSVMYPWAAGTSPLPDATDFAAVDAEYGH